MTGALLYPKANRAAQWFGGRFQGERIDPDKVVWHTTETGGWPGYSRGADAPHWTYDPDAHAWRQHYPANRSARALRNASGGVETNTDDALQVEIIAYSDERLAASRGHLPVSKLDGQALDDLAEFSRWAHVEWGIPLRVDGGWVRKNYRNPTRMTTPQWSAFAGHTGHNRVPENTHWDPAALDIDEVIRRARFGASTPPPPEGDDDMPTPAELWRYRNDQIERGDVFGILVEAYRRAGRAEDRADYATKQLNSIASGVSAIAKALIDGTVDVAELQRVNDALAGKSKGLSRTDTTE